MTADRTTSQLIAELNGVSEKNKELNLQLAELRKDRVLWRETNRQATEYEKVVQQLQQDNKGLQAEVARLRRANEVLERKLESEIEENSKSHTKWHDTEKAYKRALLDEKSKNRELKELVAFHTGESIGRSRSNSLEETGSSAYPSAPPSPVDGPSSTAKRDSAGALLKVQNENAKLMATVADLHVSLNLRDSKIRTQEEELKRQDREIRELQVLVNRVMDELEDTQEENLLGYSSGDSSEDDGGSPRTLSPVPYMFQEKHTRHQRSRSDLVDSDSETLLQAPTLNTRSRSPSLSGPAKNSLAAEFSKMGSIDELEFTSSLNSGERTLRERLSAVGLRADGNRKALKKRLHAFTKKKEKQLQNPTIPAEMKLQIVEALHAARA